MTKEFTLDATNKRLGRLASEAAMLLMGKRSADYRPNVAPGVKVTITNASKAFIDAKKRANHVYKRYSGHPGGLKEIPMKDMIVKKGYSEVFRIAIKGMLPKNSLTRDMMKNLIVEE